MKRIILLIAFCLSLSAIYAQTIDVIHLKNGFDARGTITNRTESQITLQSENGRILTIDMSEIESMEQEQKAFDPRVLIGRWACYKANGERDARFDIEINENEGFYTVSYGQIIVYSSNDNTIKGFPYDTPLHCSNAHKDIYVENGEVSYYFNRQEKSIIYASNSRKSDIAQHREYSCDVALKYIDGKLKGNIDCLQHYWVLGDIVTDETPCGKWNVYFVKY